MRFLKDIIARKARAEDHEIDEGLDLEEVGFLEQPEYEDEYEYEDEEDTDEDLWAEDDDLDLDEDDDADVDEMDIDPEPEAPETAPAPARAAPVAEHPPTKPLHEDPEDEPLAAKIWEMFDEPESAENIAPEPAEEPEDCPAQLAREAMKSMIGRPPAVERSAAADREPAGAAPAAAPEVPPMPRGGRAKTRMLGFHSLDQAVPQVFDRAAPRNAPSPDTFPVGWLVLIEGPGRGAFFTLQYGVSNIGRGEDQDIRLDFGDNSISRDSHAVIAYDDDLNAFFIGQNGKTNLVRLNGRPVLSTEELSNSDMIRIGETTLRLVAFCGPEFAWDMTDDEEVVHARAS